MTTDPFTTAARAEAERRWSPRESDRLPMDWLDEGMGSGFVLGALWARTHIGQEPTDAEVEAAALSILADEGGWDLNDEDHAFHVHEIQWKDMDEGEMSGRLASARAALSAARAARRDEKDKP